MNVNVIKELMESKRLTQRDMADKIKMSQSGFNSILKTGDCRVSVLENIADALDVHVVELLKDSPSQSTVDFLSGIFKKELFKRDKEIKQTPFVEKKVILQLNKNLESVFTKLVLDCAGNNYEIKNTDTFTSLFYFQEYHEEQLSPELNKGLKKLTGKHSINL